jgi:membrane protease subunit HflC
MNNPFFVPAILISAALLWLIVYSSTFIVTPKTQALVIRLGNPVRTVTEPGLHFKLPLLENLVQFDRRILELTGRSGEVTTSDQKRIQVSAFARFRIADPDKFYRNFRDQENATSQLTAKLNSQLRNTIGAQTFRVLLSAERVKVMQMIREGLIQESAPLGVEIVDVRIRRADLPQQNQQAVFGRMKTEREQEAAAILAKGNQDAQTRRAEADREVTVIKADATRQSEILRGEGDASRNLILGRAYGKDPNFFAFYRSLRAYEASLQGGNTTMLLSPDSPFFRYFRQNPVEPGGR